MENTPNITVHHVPAITGAVAAVVQAKAAAEVRIAEHRAGEHPYGSMRRDCPLCAQGRA